MLNKSKKWKSVQCPICLLPALVYKKAHATKKELIFYAEDYPASKGTEVILHFSLAQDKIFVHRLQLRLFKD